MNSASSPAPTELALIAEPKDLARASAIAVPDTTANRADPGREPEQRQRDLPYPVEQFCVLRFFFLELGMVIDIGATPGAEWSLPNRSESRE